LHRYDTYTINFFGAKNFNFTKFSDFSLIIQFSWLFTDFQVCDNLDFTVTESACSDPKTFSLCGDEKATEFSIGFSRIENAEKVTMFSIGERERRSGKTPS